MAKVNVAINGFGRIGRQFLKVALKNEECEVVAINDLGNLENLAYLFEYDSVYKKFDGEVKTENGNLIINGKEIRFLQESDAIKLPWGALGVDIVVESTGRFTSYDKAKVHLDAGAKRVVLSAPASEQTPVSAPNVMCGVW